MWKTTKDIEEQITTKVEYCSKLEAEITRMNLQLEEMIHEISEYHKFEGGSLKLDEILKNQRSPSIKFGLVFEEGKTSKDVDKKSKIKEEKKPVNQEKPSHTRQTNTARNDRFMENDGFTYIAHQRRRRFLAPTTMWQSSQTRFTQSFSGYYFKCNGYGHRISECKYNVSPRNFASRNMFAPLVDYAVECYNCHKYGHTARNCRNTFFSNQFQQKSFQSRDMRYNRKIPERQQTK